MFSRFRKIVRSGSINPQNFIEMARQYSAIKEHYVINSNGKFGSRWEERTVTGTPIYAADGTITKAIAFGGYGTV